MISPELSLVIAACRASFTGTPVEPATLHGHLDWPRIVELSRFHRVQALVWDSLSNALVPASAAEALRNDATEVVRKNLAAVEEARRLLDAFIARSLPLTFIKGLPLSALAYPRPLLKASIDIDLLVPAEAVGDAARLLAELGYALTVPAVGTDFQRLIRWHKSRKESVWQKGDEGLSIDLHTRLVDNPMLIPAISMSSSRRDVEIAPGLKLPTLGKEELFAYLCVHGTSSAWFRLKWITDLAALLYRGGSAEVEGLYRKSQELGAGRSAAQALLIADALYGSVEDPGLRQELMRGSPRGWLRDMALRKLTASHPAEPTEQRFGTAFIHLSQFGLLPGAWYKLSEFWRQLRDALMNVRYRER